MKKNSTQKECKPCKKQTKKDVFDSKKAKEYLVPLKGWKIVKKGTAIEKNLEFKDFVKAMSFVEQVADVAEEAGHHPDIYIWYNKVRLELSTHSQGGLTESDFIVASRIDQLWLV